MRGRICNYGDDHMSTKLYADQLSAKQRLIHELEAENAALQAQLGSNAFPWDSDEGDLLVAVAEVLQIGRTFGNPVVQGQVTDHTKTGRQKPHSDEPKGGLRDARSAAREFIRGVESRVERFHNRRENDFRNTTVRDVQKECEWCGVGFVPMRSSARFHSDACRQASYRDTSVTENELHDLPETG